MELMSLGRCQLLDSQNQTYYIRLRAAFIIIRVIQIVLSFGQQNAKLLWQNIRCLYKRAAFCFLHLR
jgi:hypothetical protein